MPGKEVSLMFGIGTTEVLVILVVALLVIGPSKLPEVARSLGKGLAEFKRMSSDVKRSIDLESHVQDMDKSSSADGATGHAAGTKAQQSSKDKASAESGQKSVAQEDTDEQLGEQPAKQQQEEEIPEVKYTAQEGTGQEEKDKGVQDG
ncbi:MAG: Sec-independent protein translocase protein TatB [Thermodesulfobacteriota bacterium]